MKLKFFCDRYKNQNMNYLTFLPEATADVVKAAPGSKRVWIEVEVLSDSDLFGSPSVGVIDSVVAVESSHEDTG